MNRLEGRISKLERKARATRGRVIIWRQLGQTAKEAVDERFPEEHFPDGPPADIEVMVIGWEEHEGEADDRASIAGMKPLDGGESGKECQDWQ